MGTTTGKMGTQWCAGSRNSTAATCLPRTAIRKIPPSTSTKTMAGSTSTTPTRTESSTRNCLPTTIETSYEGEHNASRAQIRRQAYWALLCGATGQFLGNRPIWLFDPGWERALDAIGSQDMARLLTLFRSRPWYALAPDDKHQVVVDGLGEFNGLDYLAAARSPDGGLVMAYVPSSRAFTGAMTKISGNAPKPW